MQLSAGLAYAFDQLIVEGLVPATAKNATCSITDDDDQLLTEAQLPIALPKLNAPAMVIPKLQPFLLAAYIQLVDANSADWNTPNGPNLPFSLNECPFCPDGITGVSVFGDFQDLTDSSTYWAHLVSFGYQPASGDDGDHSTENVLFGGTPEPLNIPKGYSIVFVETVRELWAAGYGGLATSTSSQDKVNARDAYWSFIAGDIGHEIGHAPGRQGEKGDHDEEGIMGQGNIKLQEFSSPTIKRFRKSRSWWQQ